MGRGLADLLDDSAGPPPLVLAFAALQVGGDSDVNHPTVDFEPVPVGLASCGRSPISVSMVGETRSVKPTEAARRRDRSSPMAADTRRAGPPRPVLRGVFSPAAGDGTLEIG